MTLDEYREWAKTVDWTPLPAYVWGGKSLKVPKPPRCTDFDEDCVDIPDKVKCYLYDPFKGYCPHLSVK